MSETCGPIPRAAFARLSPDGSCWRTVQLSLLADISASSCVTWPRWGLCARGACYEQRMSAPPISARASLSSVPTPTANDHKNSGYQKRNGRVYLNLPGAVGAAKVPTPRASDQNSPALGRPRHQQALRDRVAEAARAPTPTATDHKGSSRRGQRRGQLSEATEPGSGGRLNPQWVAWLMGWPLGWTSPEPLPPEEIEAWRRLHDCTPTQRRLSLPEDSTTKGD